MQMVRLARWSCWVQMWGDRVQGPCNTRTAAFRAVFLSMTCESMNRGHVKSVPSLQLEFHRQQRTESVEVTSPLDKHRVSTEHKERRQMGVEGHAAAPHFPCHCTGALRGRFGRQHVNITALLDKGLFLWLGCTPCTLWNTSEFRQAAGKELLMSLTEMAVFCSLKILSTQVAVRRFWLTKIARNISEIKQGSHLKLCKFVTYLSKTSFP